jgi:hypothetical protein
MVVFSFEPTPCKTAVMAAETRQSVVRHSPVHRNFLGARAVGRLAGRTHERLEDAPPSAGQPVYLVGDKNHRRGSVTMSDSRSNRAVSQ